MKKDKRITHILIGMILGIALGGTSAYAAIIYNSNQVSYSNSTSGLTSTNVQSAIDELSNKIKTCLILNNINFGSASSGSSFVTERIFASRGIICINYNGIINCFTTDFEIEADHLKEVFSNNCAPTNGGPQTLNCEADGEFGCYLDVNGTLSCDDYSDNIYCEVNRNGQVYCEET